MSDFPPQERPFQGDTFRSGQFRQPPRREPPINAPSVIVAVILLLTIVHGVRYLLPTETDIELMLALSFIPARLTLLLDPSQAQAIFEAAFNDGPQKMALTRLILTDGSAPWSVLTYSLLHGSWMHLGFNGLWLLAFGTPVARRFGAGRFLILFVSSAIAGALLYWIIRPMDVMPMVGASGAISGVMAAAARFIFTPRQSGGILSAPYERSLGRTTAPAQPLITLLGNRQAMGFIIAWFAINLLAGLAPGVAGVDGGIAWEAHLGGFIAGLALFMPLDPVRRG